MRIIPNTHIYAGIITTLRMAKQLKTIATGMHVKVHTKFRVKLHSRAIFLINATVVTTTRPRIAVTTATVATISYTFLCFNSSRRPKHFYRLLLQVQ